MCAFGPCLLGYQNATVDAAIHAQMLRGDAMTGPTEKMVELAEMLTDAIPWSEWAMFGKNGNDATTMALKIARAATGRGTIMRMRGSYHGSAAQWREGDAELLRREGVTPGATQDIANYRWNDLASVRAKADELGDDWAGIIVPTFRWPFGKPAVLATAEFLTLALPQEPELE